MQAKNKAIEVFDNEILELNKVKNKLDDSFEQVVELINQSEGKVVIIGIGKSGIIGKKIAATLSSTGTQSIFINAAEGLHGDLGMVGYLDVAILISNSGSSEEVLNTIPSLKKIGVKIVAFTGNKNSKLAEESDYLIDIGVDKEACPLKLAPTSSTTATLVMGDSLAIALMEQKKFQSTDFALYHPGGLLGRRLLTRVEDVLIPADELLFVDEEETLISILSTHNINNGVFFIKSNNDVKFILTDGDIRRILQNKGEKALSQKLKDLSVGDYIYIDNKGLQLYEVLSILEEKNISFLPIKENGKIIGIIKYSNIYTIFN